MKPIIHMKKCIVLTVFCGVAAVFSFSPATAWVTLTDAAGKTLVFDTLPKRLVVVGAGTGKWSVFAASYASKVTALEPSLAMQDVLREKIQKQRIANINIVTGTWPEDEVESHDYVLASHSMYGVGNFKAFVGKMSAAAKKACIMLLRAPYADVVMEADGTWPGWANESFEEAFGEIKNRLGLADNTDYDGFLTELLHKNLTVENGKYVWPTGNRSALVYWEI